MTGRFGLCLAPSLSGGEAYKTSQAEDTGGDPSTLKSMEVVVERERHGQQRRAVRHGLTMSIREQADREARLARHGLFFFFSAAHYTNH